MFTSVSRCVTSFGAGAASLPPEKDFKPFSDGFAGASSALRRTKEKAGERGGAVDAPTPVTSARSAGSCAVPPAAS